MLADKDDDYENPEESEYHFTDEDTSYDVESDTPKISSTTSIASDSKGNLMARVSQSKRLLGSIAAFAVLVFIVYKMVSPGSSTPSTDIVAPTVSPVTAVQNTPTQSVQVAVSPKMPTAPMNQSQTSVATTQSMMPAAAVPAQTAAQQSAPMNAPPPIPGQVMPGAGQPMASMPGVIPVQSQTAPQYNPNQQALIGQLPAAVESKIASIANGNEKLIGQVQVDAMQKMNDYAQQNKALQDEVQTLNTRVASMEAQMTQLIQLMTNQAQNAAKQQQPTATTPPPPLSSAEQPLPAVPASPVVEPRVSYNVQAIIPGRAWLRSDGGETVTVAEGDVIKDLGRVTKIDPYDGVVEINTGNKVLSLSYGNGG